MWYFDGIVSPFFFDCPRYSHVNKGMPRDAIVARRCKVLRARLVELRIEFELCVRICKEQASRSALASRPQGGKDEGEAIWGDVAR